MKARVGERKDKERLKEKKEYNRERGRFRKIYTQTKRERV